MIEILNQSTGKVLAIQLSGKLLHRDFQQFVPILEKRIEEHGSVRCFIELTEFHGIELHALWDEIKFDVHHFADIEQLALIGENRWEAGMAVFCKPFSAAKVRYFDESKADEATAWIHEGLPSRSTHLISLMKSVKEYQGTKQGVAIESRLIEMVSSTVATTRASLRGNPRMPLHPYPIGDREDDSEPCPSQHPAKETDCTCLTERLPKELRRTGYSVLNDIGVSVREGVVILEGRVASYYQKQLAQEAVRRVFGHAIIRNELEIAGRNERRAQPTTSVIPFIL